MLHFLFITALQTSLAENISSPPLTETIAAPHGLPEAPSWKVDPINPNTRLSSNMAQSSGPGNANAGTHQTTAADMVHLQDIANSAFDGETIILPPGDYASCAVWKSSNLTIRAAKPLLTRFRRATCEGKAIFVLRGRNTTIDGIVFDEASVPDKNGAGIRLEAPGLVIRNSSFTNNENGILTSNDVGGDILIENSRFDGNGKCDPGCAHGIYIGRAENLTVRRSTFTNTHSGHHIKSRALHTLIENTLIDDGAKGNSSYLVELPNGGDLILRNSVLIKGAKAENHSTLISIGAEGVTHPPVKILLENNRFTSQMQNSTSLIINRTAIDPVMRGNKIFGAIKVGP